MLGIVLMGKKTLNHQQNRALDRTRSIRISKLQNQNLLRRSENLVHLPWVLQLERRHFHRMVSAIQIRSKHKLVNQPENLAVMMIKSQKPQMIVGIQDKEK